MKCHLLLFCVLASGRLQAQSAYTDTLNQDHDRISKTGMLVLSGWSGANIIGALGSSAVGERKYFYRNNLVWGAVNLGIAQTSYWLLRRNEGKRYHQAQTAKRLETTEKLFLFNTGLDLAYVALGLYNREKALRYTGEKKDRLRGTGTSLLAQGGFLFLFDGVMYLVHNSNGNKNTSRNKLSVNWDSNGVGLSYTVH